MNLGYAEIADLEEEVKQRLDMDITKILTEANRKGTLGLLLEMLGMKDLLEMENDFEPYEDAKVLVIGDSQVSEDKLLGIINSFNLDKGKFEFCLGYENAKKYNFRTLHYNANYCAVLIGPLPHSAKGKGDSSSIIAEMENKPGYPKVIRMAANDSLKITKTSFKAALEILQESTVQ